MIENTVIESNIANRAIELLRHVPVLPRRFLLDTGSVHATSPILRGVWGRALHGLDKDAYQSVFHSEQHGRPSTYIVRPAPADSEFAPAVDFILIGEAIEYDDVLLRAWDVASGMGLDKEREPFFIRRRVAIGPDGDLLDDAHTDGVAVKRGKLQRGGQAHFAQRTPQNEPVPDGRSCENMDRLGNPSYRSAWSLADAVWPLDRRPETTPCRLCFPAPLSLVRSTRRSRRDKELVEAPTLTDIVAKGCRRIGGFLPIPVRDDWNKIQGELVQLSKEIAATPWRGEHVDLKRYSGSQQKEFRVPGVCGYIDLHEGAGNLWPVLAALQWIHVGKSTNVGLGQLIIESLE